MKRRYLRKREGFTLIELLIVLAIIGVLMTIGIPIYTGALEGAKAAVVASNMRIVVDGLRTDLTVNGKPSTSTTVDKGKFYNAGGMYIKVDSKTEGKYYFAYNDSESDWKIDVAYDHGSKNKSFLGKIGDKLAGCDNIFYTDSAISNGGAVPSSSSTTPGDDSRTVICELSFQKIGY